MGEVIGLGGFGAVYRAWIVGDAGFCRPAAIKVLRDGVATREGSRQLLREARLLGKLRHRTILKVDDLVRLDGSWAVVTEYVPGANLFQITRYNRVPVPVAAEIAAEVASALHAAWQGRGPDGRPLRLLHRDVKSSNVQISTAGEVKLLDFGIAGVHRPDGPPSSQLGTPSYMAPERFLGREGPAADIYALGVVVCEAISRRRWPPAEPDPVVHRAELARRLRTVRDRAGPDADRLLPLLTRMLSYDPGERPTAREVERSCREIRSGLVGPWLPEWAEAVLPRVCTTHYEDPMDLSGRVLTEDRSPRVLYGWMAAAGAGAAAAMLLVTAVVTAVVLGGIPF